MALNSRLQPRAVKILVAFLCVAAGSGATSLARPASLSLQEPGQVEPLLVRIAYSPELRHRTGWSRELECAVSRTNTILVPFTGRPVKIVDKVAWMGGSMDASPYELRQRLVGDIEPGPAEIVIGLASGGGSISRAGEWGGGEVFVEEGLAHYTRGYVVIEVGAGDICEGFRLLAHELAHVFGGVHRTGDDLLMTTGGFGVQIDPLNEALLTLHRDRGFGPGIAPLGGEELRAMWRLARADIDQPTTWLVVGILAARMGKPEAACAYYERALAIAPDFAAAHANLGHSEFQLGNYDSAEQRYLRALELAPGDGMVHNNLAAIYYGRGQAEAALPHLRAALIVGFDVAPEFIAAVESVTGQKVRQ